MSVELKVPTLGESITEAVVGKWHKQVGDSVAADEPVVVLETDKVMVDVQAPAAGALEAISVKEGDTVKIGDVLGSIAPGAAGKQAQQNQPAHPERSAAESRGAPSTALGPSGSPAQQPAAAAPSAPGGNGHQRGPTPVARAMAEQAGIDAAALTGTGVGGRVTKDDVAKATQVQAKAPPPAPAPVVTPSGRAEERVKMTPLRRRVAERLLQAQSTAAILTTFNEVDLGEVIALRKKYADKYEKKHGVRLGFMSFFVKAAVEALKTFPAVNASIEGDEVVLHHYYDIGIAVSGSRGLVVPVLRDADLKSMAEIEKTIGDFGARAKADRLKLEELQGGTFTISNGGVFGSMLSTPILNPPQSGILGMHNIVERPVVRDGQIVVRPVMYLALSYDHRLIDGREAVQFLVRVKDCIETPERLLLEI